MNLVNLTIDLLNVLTINELDGLVVAPYTGVRGYRFAATETDPARRWRLLNGQQ